MDDGSTSFFGTATEALRPLISNLPPGSRRGVAMPALHRDHYAGDYAVRSAVIRAAAYADPGTTCWRCGLTLAAEQARQPRKRVTWHCGHVVDGDARSPLRAEHSTCNQSAGAVAGRVRAGLNPSRRWY